MLRNTALADALCREGKKPIGGIEALEWVAGNLVVIFQGAVIGNVPFEFLLVDDAQWSANATHLLEKI